MNAITYIQQYGVEKARDVVEGAPSESTKVCITGIDGVPTYLKLVGGDYWFFWKNGFSKACQGAYKSTESRGGICDLSDLKRLVESVDIISKFDSVQEAKDAISNAPDGSTEFRKLSCSTRYIKVGPRFFEYWDGVKWCRPTVPFTDETHILRFTELSRLKQAIADYEAIGGEHV